MEISFQIICNIREKKSSTSIIYVCFSYQMFITFSFMLRKKNNQITQPTPITQTLYTGCVWILYLSKKLYRAFKLSTMNIFFYAGEHNIKITLVLFEEFATHFWWFNINRIVFINLWWGLDSKQMQDYINHKNEHCKICYKH